MPRPIEPVCGTQNIRSLILLPPKYSGICGPGTLVATAEALRLNISSAKACTASGAMPTAASAPKVATAWRDLRRTRMQSATRSSRRIGLASPTGRSRNTRPKWLPSCLACSSGRRFTGTVARMVTPSMRSPRSIR